MRGLMNKTAYEVSALTFFCGVGLFIIEGILAPVFWIFQEDLTEDIMKLEFFRNMVSSLLGSDIGANMGPGLLVSLPWAHPLVLSILWAHTITFCTRMPAGEIDRATIDVLFSLPVSRWKVYISETIVWLGAGLAVILFAVLGCVFGNLFVPAEGHPDWSRLGYVVLNLYCLYLTIGAITWLMSVLSDRRGRAVGAAFGILVALFLWNFLEQYWSFAEQTSFLNPRSYYKPMPILTDGVVPVLDVSMLIACAVPIWIAGGVVFSRRDICTV